MKVFECGASASLLAKYILVFGRRLVYFLLAACCRYSIFMILPCLRPAFYTRNEQCHQELSDAIAPSSSTDAAGQGGVGRVGMSGVSVPVGDARQQISEASQNRKQNSPLKRSRARRTFPEGVTFRQSCQSETGCNVSRSEPRGAIVILSKL